MKRRAPPPSPSSASSDDDRARLLACQSITHAHLAAGTHAPSQQPQQPPSKRNRPHTPTATSTSKPPRPRAGKNQTPPPTPRTAAESERAQITSRVAQLLDSYLEKTLGGVEDEEKVKKENGENGADVPYASLRSPAAVEHFRLFRDSRPGRIGLASKRRRLPDVEEGEEESSSDEERLERVRSVVVDAPAPVEKKPA